MIKNLLKFVYFIIILSIFLLVIFKISIVKEYFEAFSKWLFPENPNRNGELFKIVLSILGALGILFGLYISLRRAKAIEEGVKKQGLAINLQSNQIELSRKSQTDERFKNAVEHLGSDSEPIILGGIAELNQIVKEYPAEYSEIVFNILNSYIRSNAKKNKNTTVLQTIINSLFKNSKNNPYKNYKGNLRGADLIGVEFDNLILDNSDLSRCKLSNLKNSSFKNVDLQYSLFFFGEVENIDFCNTKMHKTCFYGGRLKNLQLNIDSEFGTLGFFNINFNDVSFDSCNIHDWSFIACNFNKCTFYRTHILYSKFSLSNFNEVVFKNLNSFSNNDFRAAFFNSTTMENVIIIHSDFRGLRNESEFNIHFRNEINELLKYETDYKGIDLKNVEFYKCQTGKISQEDIDEILVILDKYENIVFDKKQSNK
ncbi:pentapeptide repeat-containing protein [Tenacibaculum discolor]|uniref:pentapeptide repeat-containing protein n=1 Tax=Tenacibaculum discolor TaxID=361581 RepID=UPI003F7B2461